MGKTEWRASSSGPDVMDVMVILRAIEVLHNVTVAVVLSPEQIGAPTSCDIALSALSDVLPNSDKNAGIGVHSAYPNGRGTSLWGEAYALAWQLDEALSKEWRQASLFE